MNELIKQISIRILPPYQFLHILVAWFSVKNNLRGGNLCKPQYLFFKIVLYCKLKKNPLFQTEVFAGDYNSFALIFF